MLVDQNFLTVDQVMTLLTNNIGKLIAEVTKVKVILANQDTIPTVEGPYVLVDETALQPLDWKTAELVDQDGMGYSVSNYEATYTLTAYRGERPHVTLSRVMQAFGLPFIYDKYFPSGSPFAYSSSSSINKMRVPLNAQFFENRARVQIIFNISFIERDFGEFEELEQINIDLGVTYVDDRDEYPVEVFVPKPGITSVEENKSGY